MEQISNMLAYLSSIPSCLGGATFGIAVLVQRNNFDIVGPLTKTDAHAALRILEEKISDLAKARVNEFDPLYCDPIPRDARATVSDKGRLFSPDNSAKLHSELDILIEFTKQFKANNLSCYGMELPCSPLAAEYAIELLMYAAHVANDPDELRDAMFEGAEMTSLGEFLFLFYPSYAPMNYFAERNASSPK